MLDREVGAWRRGQLNPEAATGTGCRLYTADAMHALDSARDNSQADSGTVVLAHVADAFKQPKDAPVKGRGDSDPVILDAYSDVVPVRFSVDPNVGGHAGCDELHSVADEIAETVDKKRTLSHHALCLSVGGDFHDCRVRHVHRQQITQQRPELDWLKLNFFSRHLAVLQEIVGEVIQVASRSMDALGTVPRFIVQCRRGLQEKSTEPF